MFDTMNEHRRSRRTAIRQLKEQDHPFGVMHRKTKQSTRRLELRSAVALGTVALSFTACILPAHAGAKLPVRIIDDKFSSFIAFEGPEIGKMPLIGVSRYWHIETIINKKSVGHHSQLVVRLNYNGDWRWYDYANDEQANALETKRVASSVGSSCAGILGCDLYETVVVDLPDAELQSHLANGFQIKLTAKSGDGLVLDITGEQIQMQMDALRRYADSVAGLPAQNPPGQVTVAPSAAAPIGPHVTLGISFVPLPSSVAALMKRPELKAVLVAVVVPGSIADRAGLRVGDAIYEFNGQPVTSASDLQVLVARVQPGTDVLVKTVRGPANADITAKF